jgi:hypothetical protein
MHFLIDHLIMIVILGLIKICYFGLLLQIKHVMVAK